MKKLDTSAIAPGISLPMKRGVLEFMGEINSEMFAQIIIAQIGDSYDPTQMYIISGLNDAYPGFSSSPGFQINVSSGVVFLGGELFLVNASGDKMNEGPSNDFYLTPLLSFNNRYDDADPVKFNGDGVSRNILQSNMMAITSQLISSYSDIKTRFRNLPRISFNTVSTSYRMDNNTDNIVNIPKITPGDSIFIQMAAMTAESQSLSIWANNTKIIKVIDGSSPLFGYDLLVTLLTKSLSDDYYWRIEPISTAIIIADESQTTMYRINIDSCLTITSTGLGTFTPTTV